MTYPVVADRTRDTSLTTGTGDFTLSGSAPTGNQTFASRMSTNDYCWYTIQNASTGEWETGKGKLTASTTLQRSKVYQSSNSDSLVSFAAGTKDVFMTLPARFFHFNAVRAAKTASYTIIDDDYGKLIDSTSGTNTISFDPVAQLGTGFYCYVRNSSTAEVTLDPDSSETIDGLTSYKSYAGEVRLITCDGSALYSVVLSPFTKEFIGSGTFTVPPGYTRFLLDMLGAAGGGGSGCNGGAATSKFGGGGGGGGMRVITHVLASECGSSVSITVGGGGTGGTAVAATSGNNGSDGTDTTFGSLRTAKAGKGGTGGSTGSGRAGGAGGGYGTTSATPVGFEGGNASTTTNNSGIAVFGGGGGGGSGTPAGVSGDGGDAGFAGGGGGGGAGESVSNAFSSAVGSGGKTNGTSRGSVANGGTSNASTPVAGGNGVNIGDGGGGGGAATTATAANGGNGARGGGGGGGGCTRTGQTSGAGGNGGDGFCRITGE